MKYARSNFMTPIPAAASFIDLNAMLAQRCKTRQTEHAGRHAETIGERLAHDHEALRDLPAVALELARSGPPACHRRHWCVIVETTISVSQNLADTPHV